MLKKMLRYVGIGLLCLGLFLACILALAWKDLGSDPSGEHLQRISQSPQYDPKSKRFVNPNQEEYDKMMKAFDFQALLHKRFFGKEVRTPSQTMPEIKPDLLQFLQSDSLTYHWLGHSTILARLDSQTLLLDPIFTNAAPVPLAIGRFQPPVLRPEELPKIDAIFISHDHYDHLDRPSILPFKDTQTHFFVPLGVSSHLISWGIPTERITELDWWESAVLGNLQVVCTPSQHFSGRRGPPGNTTLWASWVVMGQSERFYFSGDSGYGPHFERIGEKYGPFDVAFMESGQYNTIWPLAHMFPQETVQASLDIHTRKTQPIHWGMFVLSTHDWFAPPEKVIEHAQNTSLKILTPQIGASVTPSQPQRFDRWWESLPSHTPP
ncbi:MAG: MBL fold metallo-hydrolase [Myxococcota bacterium]|nr:MBL fold metallo-hydrolase [Myxococcota bacterium]